VHVVTVGHVDVVTHETWGEQTSIGVQTVTGAHVVMGPHTVDVDWHGCGSGWHMVQYVVVITCVVVVQLVGHGTVEVMVVVTVPTT
jgi:hypothetical protein